LARRAIIGFEALIRWQHPERGMVSPAEFIPLAEQTGLIVPMGEWMLRTGCAQLAAWHAMGFGQLTMSINLSARQFDDPKLVSVVADTMRAAGVAPQSIKLEITESMVANHPQQAIERMHELKSLGVGLSMDDFGTGYSSLGYLTRFPLDTLKIDRSFVRDITTDQSKALVAGAVVALAHQLSLDVTAEGVETVPQRDFLASLGCDQAQGYLYSPPVDAQRARALLEGPVG
jgi:EAL domain-containing protein (putative c-di-GMP-specific phosphodiesterase class I)